MRLLYLFIFLAPAVLFSQSPDTLPVYDYSTGRDFEIGGIKVTGATFSDNNAIIGVTGLKVGDRIKIPGPEVSKALKALWRLRLFTDVQIIKENTLGDVIFLEIFVLERPRLTFHSFSGLRKSYHDDLTEIVNKNLVKGGIVTESALVQATEGIQDYFIDKGFLDATALVQELPDTSRLNSVRLVFEVNRGERIKIDEIAFEGNTEVKDKKLRKQLKETKERKKLFASSKFLKDKFQEDKQKVIDYYNNNGYRDARIVKDSMWRNEKGNLVIHMDVTEGNPYYFRNIAWKGNSLYDSAYLTEVLGIARGDIYSTELLEKRLRFSQDSRDVSTLYMDDGYLFFNVDPVEVAIVGDSIDMEMRIFEGPQATIDKVIIQGNDRTHEHVIRREVRTRPGEKFSRSDIIRSQRQILALGYFNPEKLGINTPVNPDRGTVDIEYQVEERPSDQLELSAGWGGNRRVIGTLGVTFNNFSMRNIFNREAWRPLPQGDGQRLSIRAQTNADFYQSYNLSFTEPWLGGRKPNSLTVATFFNKFAYGVKGSENRQTFNITQGSVSLGTRLKWPDDNFVSRTSINLQTLSLKNWSQGLFITDNGSIVSEGSYNNFSITQSIARSTVADPLFPREGSLFELSVQFTPPYSMFNNKNYVGLSDAERFKWLEYHKWRFNAEWYTSIVGKLVLKAQAKIGMLGFYNRDIGTSPFERFQLGGDGINNQQIGYAGVDIISLRGYEVGELESNLGPNGREVATPVFDKFTMEFRYPLSLNPSSTIYVHTFLQGGNAWRSIRDFNPFELKRSAGFGLRVFLPMFGILGFDYGFGFDKNLSTSQDGKIGKFSIVLGFEPE